MIQGAKLVDISTRINKDSIKYYRYSIIENDTTTLVSNGMLTKVDFVWNERSDFPGYLTMNFGVSNIINKKLTLKMYKTSNPDRVTTVIFYNKPLKPVKVVEKYLITQGRLLKTPYKNFYATNPQLLKNNISLTVDEKTKGIYVSFKKTDMDFVYHIRLNYRSKGGETYTSDFNNWNYSTTGGIPSNFINANYFSNPGEYELLIAPQTGSQLVDSLATKIRFKVLPAPKPYSVKQLVVIGVIALVCFISLTVLVILLIKRNDRKKLLAANRQIEVTENELNLVRSQLNPHFVFNALTGIQNLMNKNEVEKANGYLNRFANLTRNILNDDKSISIADEVRLLDDYLSMEQLRFQFKYEIQVNRELSEYIDIPVMLIQPFVENAVKHGVQSLKEQGQISIMFIKDYNNIIIMIKDNGKGFDLKKKHKGLGLKLSEKRIALLNNIYKECPILMNIISADAGTTVQITLTNWL